MITVKKMFLASFLLTLAWQQISFAMNDQGYEIAMNDDDQQPVSAYLIDIFKLIKDTSILLELCEPNTTQEADGNSYELVVNNDNNQVATAQRLSQDTFTKLLVSRESCAQLTLNGLKIDLQKVAIDQIAQFKPKSNDLLAEIPFNENSDNGNVWFESLAQIIYEKMTIDDSYALIPNIVVQVGYETVTIYQTNTTSKIILTHLEGYAQKLFKYPEWNKNLLVRNSLCCAGSTALCPVAYLCFVPTIALTVLLFVMLVHH